MAKENIRKFYDELVKNENLQAMVKSAEASYTDNEGNIEDVVEKILIPIAKESGYEFTISEYRQVQKDIIVESGISEAELENVSGGGFCAIIGYGHSLGVCIFAGKYLKEGEYDYSNTPSFGVGGGDCTGLGWGFGGFF